MIKGAFRRPFLFVSGEFLATLLFDPSSAVVESIGGEAAIRPERLAVDWIRSRFSNPPDWQPEVRIEKKLQTAFDPPTPASVLIPIIAREHGLSMLLTRRTDHLHDHPGQVCFPGGRVEKADDSAIDTALRETEEEVGLDRRYVDVIGSMPEYITATGYRVTPIVSIIDPLFQIKPDPYEVAEVFEVPLSYLMDGMNHQRIVAEFPPGMRNRSFYAIPYEKYFIWGATAGMLRNLFHFLRA